MQKYVTNPDTEILGQSIQAVFNSINFEEIKDKFEIVMKKYGYPDITVDPNAWHPLQLILDFYKAINTQEDLVSVGVKIFDVAQVPPEINSIPTAIQLLMAIHNLNLRNIPAEDGYRDTLIEDHHVRFTEVTSFPHDLFYGYVYGIARRFRPANADFTVTRTYLNEANPDADGAIYDVVWKERIKG